MARLYTARVASLLGTLVVATALSIATTPGVSLAANYGSLADHGYVVGRASCPSATFCTTVLSWHNNSGWSSPTPIGTEIINGGNASDRVSCPTPSFCMAVYGYGNAYRWNGRAWSSPTPIGSGLKNNRYISVSCPTTTFCMAVAGNGNAYRWNGRAWSRPANIYSGNTNVTDSVSCSSPSFCMAVDLVNAYRWNGRIWSSPTILEYGYGINSVSCPSPSFCMAVAGNSAYRWNGKTWSGATLIDSINSFNSLNSVSCPSPSFCMAVDVNGNAYRWNGRAWSSPTPTGSNLKSYTYTEAVSCPSPSFCMAVDGHGEAYRWNGRAWSSPTTPDGGDAINSVSCPTTTFCMAVTDFYGALSLSSGSIPPPRPFNPGTVIAPPLAALVVADRIRQARRAWRLRSARQKGTGMQEPAQSTRGGRIRRILNSPDNAARRLSSKVSFLQGRQDLVRRLMPLAIFQAASVAFIADEVAVGDLGVGTIINMGLFVLSGGMSIRDILHARSAPDAPVQPPDIDVLEAASVAPMQSGASGDLLFDPAPISTQVAVSVPIGDLTCPSCGTTNATTSRFCKSCGSALSV